MLSPEASSSAGRLQCGQSRPYNDIPMGIPMDGPVCHPASIEEQHECEDIKLVEVTVCVVLKVYSILVLSLCSTHVHVQ